MTFALSSVFEPYIVKHIYELAEKPNTVDVKGDLLPVLLGPREIVDHPRASGVRNLRLESPIQRSRLL